MHDIPLNLLSLYADVLQRLKLIQTAPASISRKHVDGKVHLYAAIRHGTKRRQLYLGPESSAVAQSKAAQHRQAANQHRQIKKSIQALKHAGIAAPRIAIGQLLASFADDGLFQQGAVLVGTLAFQHYPCLVGAMLPDAAAETQDADVAATRIALKTIGAGAPLLDTLKSVNASFAPAPPFSAKLPYRFATQDGFLVELLATPGRSDEPVLLPKLQCSALPMPYLDYLLDDPVDAVTLYNGGVLVRVPDPARFAVHKLIVHQLRKDRTKAIKDLLQAKLLAHALRKHDPSRLDWAFTKAIRRGPRWKQLVDKGRKLLD